MMRMGITPPAMALETAMMVGMAMVVELAMAGTTMKPPTTSDRLLITRLPTF